MRLLPRFSLPRSGAVAGILVTAMALATVSAPARAADPVSPWIVVLKDSVADPGASAAAQAAPHGAKVGKVYDMAAGGCALKGYSVEATAEQIEAIRADPQVESVEPDRVARVPGPRAGGLPADGLRPALGGGPRSVPFAGDPLRAQQWGLFQIGASTATAVPAPPSVGVAVLDTGVDLDHGDLHLAGSVNFSDSPSPDDLYGHGTHVAGIVQALNNGTGVVGAAPGTTLWSVKVLGDDGSGDLSGVLDGLGWVTQNARTNNIRVANLSLGATSPSQAEQEAVRCATAAGVSIVASAGNDGTTQLNYPAAYPEAFAVAATDQSNLKASFSNYGADWVDIAAPGVDILSTGPNHPNALGLAEYDYLSGTSMAAPHVTATIALCLTSGSCQGDPGRVFSTIGDDSLPIPGTGTQYRYGLVQAQCYWQEQCGTGRAVLSQQRAR